MLYKLALRNIIGNGWRSLINMVIIAIVMIGMIWMQAMYYSWFNLAEKQMREWEIGDGQYQQADYKRFDAFSWDKCFAEIPPELEKKNRAKKCSSDSFKFSSHLSSRQNDDGFSEWNSC
jgi:Tfp pilus assembly protein PilV